MRSKTHLWLVPLFALSACLDAELGDTEGELGSTTAACSDDDDEQRFRPLLPAAARHDLQQTLTAAVTAGVAPGVSITVDHPRYRRFAGASGVADVESGEAITPAHRFRAGSMLKTSVATAVLQLVERRRLSLDATLPQLLPPATTAHVAEASNITLRMLLSHTAGVPEFTGPDFNQLVLEDPERIWTVDEYLARSAARPRPFAPGAGWSYSNTHYILLGQVLEATTGEPWRVTVKKRVFDRAGLRDSSLPRPGNPACRGCARGYERIAGELIDLTEVDPSMADAAGGDALITTTADLATFLRALDRGQLFDRRETLALMKSFISAPLPQEAQTHYGLGIARFEVGGVELIGHLGGTAGFQGFMLLDTTTGVTVTGFMNRRPGGLAQFILPVLAATSRLP